MKRSFLLVLNHLSPRQNYFQRGEIVATYAQPITSYILQRGQMSENPIFTYLPIYVINCHTMVTPSCQSVYLTLTPC